MILAPVVEDSLVGEYLSDEEFDMPEVIIPDPVLDPQPGEINVLRRQTYHYINQNPTDVVLLRTVEVDDGAGGRLPSSETAINSQLVRIIQANESEATERVNQDGKTVRPTLNMLMKWDADVMRGDRFTWRGMRCEVVYITDMGYEKVAEVTAS